MIIAMVIDQFTLIRFNAQRQLMKVAETLYTFGDANKPQETIELKEQ